MIESQKPSKEKLLDSYSLLDSFSSWGFRGPEEE